MDTTPPPDTTPPEPGADPPEETAEETGPSAPNTASGLVRRCRRSADLSQRDLADRLGVSQSRVARWETGRTSPTCDELAAVASVAGWEVALVDTDHARMTPMRDDAVRDRAGRRYPAHVDPEGRGWWLPPGSHLTVEGPAALARAAATGDARVAYDRGLWRAVLRSLFGTPPDHPTREEVVASVRSKAWLSPGAGRG